MLNREWGAVDSNGKLPHLFIPSKTATLVPDFAGEDLPLAELHLGSYACNEGPALWKDTLIMILCINITVLLHRMSHNRADSLQLAKHSDCIIGKTRSRNQYAHNLCFSYDSESTRSEHKHVLMFSNFKFEYRDSTHSPTSAS